MFDIAKYLEKFRTMSNSKIVLRNFVAEAIKEACAIDVDKKRIDIKDGIVRIKERPIIKTEIFIKKVKILDLLNKKTNSKVVDII